MCARKPARASRATCLITTHIQSCDVKKTRKRNKMYSIYNENDDVIEQSLTEEQLIDFANKEFTQTDNINDAIENNLFFYDNAYDTEESLNTFGFKVVEL